MADGIEKAHGETINRCATLQPIARPVAQETVGALMRQQNRMPRSDNTGSTRL